MDVKRIREVLKLTQAELAYKLGVSHVTVNRWERGKVKPSPLALLRLRSLERRTV